MTDRNPRKTRSAVELKVTLENGVSRVIDAPRGWHIMGLLMKHRIPVGAVKSIEVIEG
jgi:hypothetical protein